MKRLSVVTAFLLFVPLLFGQDTRDSSAAPRNARRLRPTTNATHVGGYAAPRDEDDTLFVSDTGPSLDTPCTFRSGGPLIIHVYVKRYVGDDISTQVSRGLLSPTAELSMPAWDVDVEGGGGKPPEVDSVTFNGYPVANLTGANDVWNLNVWNIPIEYVKFPSKPLFGSPTPADNVIRIDIDTASSAENWCTAVDWVELEFKAIAPIFLVHGTNANSTTWDPDFTSFFRSTGALWSNDINLIPNGSILENGSLLAQRVADLAAKFGAKKCHIIAHSKGGLDTRAYLNQHYDPDRLKVLSVYTLSTPHHGTIMSDIMVASRASSNPSSSNFYIEQLIEHDYTILRWLGKTPQGDALRDQTTYNMTNFNLWYADLPPSVKFYNYGANADVSGNGLIEDSEAQALLGTPLVTGMNAAIGTWMYKTIGNVATITTIPKPGGTSIEVSQTNSPFAKNDLVTSIPSAHSPIGNYLGSLLADHSGMKTTALASEIFERIKSDFPIQ